MNLSLYIMSYPCIILVKWDYMILRNCYLIVGGLKIGHLIEWNCACQNILLQTLLLIGPEQQPEIFGIREVQYSRKSIYPWWYGEKKLYLLEKLYIQCMKLICTDYTQSSPKYIYPWWDVES